MADSLLEEEPLTQAPPKWSAVEAAPRYQQMSRVDKRATFLKWDDYSQQYAKEQGLWDDPDFQKEYLSRAQKTVDSLHQGGALGASIDRSVVNSYNLVKNTARAAKRGWLEGTVSTEFQQPNPDLRRTTATQKIIDEHAPTAEFTTAWDDKVAPRESWEAFKTDPVGNVAQLLAGSFGTQLASVVPYLSKIPERTWQGGAIGTGLGVMAGPTAPITGPALGVAGFAGGFKHGLSEAQMAGSYAAEYGGDMMDSFRKAGVDVTNYDQMKAVFDDPAKIKEIKEHAQKKAVPVAIGDGILGVIAGSMFPGSPLAKGPVKKIMSKIGQWAGEMLFQGGGSATAEAVSQVASEGKIYSPKSVIAEFGADVVADVVGVGVGRAADALVNAKPAQQAKFAAVAPTVNALKENNAPLTAQALVKNTLKEAAVEDPDLLSELIDQEAPEGTFTEDLGDEKFAPPETRTPEEALDALSPELSAPLTDEIAPEQIDEQPATAPTGPARGESVDGETEPLPQTNLLPQPDTQTVPPDVAPELGEASAVSPGAVVTFGGRPAVVVELRGDGTAILKQASEQGREVFFPARVDQITPDEEAAFRPEPSPLNVQKPEVITAKERIAIERIKKFLDVQTDVATDLFYHPDPREGVLDVLTASGVPSHAAAESPEHREAFTRTVKQSVDFINKQREAAPPLQITPNEQPLPAGSSQTQPLLPGEVLADRSPLGATPAAGPAGISGPVRAGSEDITPATAVKPRSQSPASFTPEQNAVHSAFIAQEPPPLEKPEEAQHFSSWVQKSAPKRPVVLFSEGGQTAVITPSSKPDRKFQLTFMENGIDEIPEAFHDIPAQSVDEAIGEAYRRGFTGTQNYKNYDRTGKTSTPGEGISSQNPEGMAGQRPRVVPGAPEGVRAEVPAPGAGTAGGRPVTIRVWDKKNKAVVSMDANADTSLLRDLRVQDGVYKALIRCL